MSGTRHRFSRASQRRQCGELALRTLVTPRSTFLPTRYCGGVGSPHRAIANSRPPEVPAGRSAPAGGDRSRGAAAGCRGCRGSPGPRRAAPSHPAPGSGCRDCTSRALLAAKGRMPCSMGRASVRRHRPDVVVGVEAGYASASSPRGGGHSGRDVVRRGSDLSCLLPGPCQVCSVRGFVCAVLHGRGRAVGAFRAAAVRSDSAAASRRIGGRCGLKAVGTARAERPRLFRGRGAASPRSPRAGFARGRLGSGCRRSLCGVGVDPSVAPADPAHRRRDRPIATWEAADAGSQDRGTRAGPGCASGSGSHYFFAKSDI